MRLDDLIREDRVFVSTYHDLAVNILSDAGRLPLCESALDVLQPEVPDALHALISDSEHGPDATGTHWWLTKLRTLIRPG